MRPLWYSINERGPGKGLFVAGVKLPLALTELGLVDEYEFVVSVAGHLRRLSLRRNPRA